jgi:hypothetical protein
VFYVPNGKSADDAADFAVIEMDMSKVSHDPEFSELGFIDLEKVSGDWLDSSSEAVFIAYGYPHEHSEIHANKRSITATRFTVRGQYKGVSKHSPSVHTIRVSYDDTVRDF